MAATTLRYGQKSSQRDGNRLRGTHETFETTVFGRQPAFLSRDPAQADENLYRYCDNDPIIAVDPLGLTRHQGQPMTPGGFADYYIDYLIRCGRNPTDADIANIRRMLNEGCIGVVSVILGLWPGYREKESRGAKTPRPDISHCYRTYEDAVKAMKKQRCPGENLFGKTCEPRIIQVQFSTEGDSIDLGKFKKEEKSPYYDLDNDDVWKSILSKGPVGDENFDFAIEMFGDWYHASAGGPDMKIYRSSTLDMERDWWYRSHLNKDGKTMFNQRFFCVACDRELAKKPDFTVPSDLPEDIFR